MSTDSHNDGHAEGNVGHEASDFNWTGVFISLPIAVVILITFFAVSISWFKGAKDQELA